MDLERHTRYLCDGYPTLQSPYLIRAGPFHHSYSFVNPSDSFRTTVRNRVPSVGPQTTPWTENCPVGTATGSIR